MKRAVVFIVFSMLVTTSFGLTQAGLPSTSTTLRQDWTFSQPVLRNEDDSCSVKLAEATSYATMPGAPILPRVSKVLTFPLGTRILSVTCTPSPAQMMPLAAPLSRAPLPTPIGSQSAPAAAEAVAAPPQFSYRLGSGLSDGKRVMFCVLDFYPVQYDPQTMILSSSSSASFTVTYELPSSPSQAAADADLLVIAPSLYIDSLQPLLDHKAAMGWTPLLLPLENITGSSPGRDPAEQVKRAIADMVQDHGITTVLLVGGYDAMPIRECEGLGWFDENPITDLYYADLFDEFGAFCTWDANNNSIFGEEQDDLDLFPDVRLGRLACASVEEVDTVVDKIVVYETTTYGSDWFNTMIYIGGNTFRWSPGNDGERLNLIINDIMTGFTPTYIWTSKWNFNKFSINRVITEGAGFLDYSGHGFEHGMGTYIPSGLRMLHYYSMYMKDIANGYKLPIVFFDACLTAKIDFILQDLLDYYRPLDLLAKAMGTNTSVRRPCFAWEFLRLQGGGAIATIGATRVAFGGIDDGAGKISIEFFEAYTPGACLGDMVVQMQTNYITDVPHDAFTVQEFMLLGDPSLKVGGYPSTP